MPVTTPHLTSLLRGEGLVFLDFEYFGWDDPVKLAADFLLHPATPLSSAQQQRIRERMTAAFAPDSSFPARLEALTPCFGLRWALILLNEFLNEFLPERWRGRAFAQGQASWEEAKRRQLEKARQMLDKLVN